MLPRISESPPDPGSAGRKRCTDAATEHLPNTRLCLIDRASQKDGCTKTRWCNDPPLGRDCLGQGKSPLPRLVPVAIPRPPVRRLVGITTHNHRSTKARAGRPHTVYIPHHTRARYHARERDWHASRTHEWDSVDEFRPAAVRGTGRGSRGAVTRRAAKRLDSAEAKRGTVTRRSPSPAPSPPHRRPCRRKDTLAQEKEGAWLTVRSTHDCTANDCTQRCAVKGANAPKRFGLPYPSRRLTAQGEALHESVREKSPSPTRGRVNWGGSLAAWHPAHSKQ